MAGTNENLAALVPELALLVAAVACLLAGSFLPRQRQWPVRALAAAGCVAGVVATALTWQAPQQAVFGASYAIDTATNAGRVVVLAATLLVLVLGAGDLDRHPRESEYYVLLLLGALGSVVLTGANDLLLLAAGYLLASIPLYALTGLARDAAGTEAAMKYYLLGALLGVLLLTGVAVLLGAGGSTGYPALRAALPAAPPAAVAVGLVGVLAGLLFKAGAAPAHFWVPDVADGARPTVAAFVTTVPKIGALVATYRLLAVPLAHAGVHWQLAVAIVAAVSMTLGNLAAFFQTGPRRLLGYSTISQVGYLLMATTAATASPAALPGLLLYLGAYAVTNLGAFAVVCALPQRGTLADYRGLLRAHPWLALTLVVCLLGLVGTPPTGVFVGKLAVFTAAWDAGYGWLVVVAAVNTVASLFYYLRWIAPAASAPAPARDTSRGWARAGGYVAAAVSVAYGIASGAVLAALHGGLLR